jgi:hypothetical protein
MRKLASKSGRFATTVADRLVGMVVPHTVARATNCDYECCATQGYWQWCCYYPNGGRSCGGCARTSIYWC